MYTVQDYARFNAMMNEYVDTLEVDREAVVWHGFAIADNHAVSMEPPEPDRGAVACWTWVTPDQKHFLYVNIPDLGSGKLERGHSYDIGTMRVFPGQDAQTISETKAMIRAGLKKLQDMIEAEAV